LFGKNLKTIVLLQQSLMFYEPASRQILRTT
jgi:hypothetical protein